MSYVLGISASPRGGGNSEALLNAFLAGVREKGAATEILRLNSLHFRPCQACDRCAATGCCVLKDDMQGRYPQVLASRGLVLATPIYFGSLAAQLKMFIDRFQCWWHAKYRLQEPFIAAGEERPGFFIVVGAQDNEAYCESARKVVEVFYRSINIKNNGSLCFLGYDEKGTVARDPQKLKKAFQAGLAFLDGGERV